VLALAVPVAATDLDTGMELFKSKKYVEAAAAFQSLVDTSPNYDFGYYMMGMSFMQMGKSADAQKNLQKAIELNGEKFEYHYALGQNYLLAKDYAKVVATLKSAEGLAGEKYQYNLHSLRGQAYVALGKWSEAVSDLEIARAAKPSSPILDQLARSYYELGYYDKALPPLEEALRTAPNNATLRMLETNTLLNLGAEAKDDAQKDAYYKKAVTSAQKFKEMNPNDKDAHNLLGRAALGAQQYDVAVQSFRKVLAIDSNYCYAMANLGKTYIAMKNWTEAEKILTDATTCAPRMAVAYENLGFAQQKQQKLTEAIATYKKAYEIEPRESIMAAINTCEQNIEIAMTNKAASDEEARIAAELKAEEERIAAEEAKRKAYEDAQKRRDD
jgi:tetratricopeptide (TPR) repeat protein